MQKTPTFQTSNHLYRLHRFAKCDDKLLERMQSVNLHCTKCSTQTCQHVTQRNSIINATEPCNDSNTATSYKLESTRSSSCVDYTMSCMKKILQKNNVADMYSVVQQLEMQRTDAKLVHKKQTKQALKYHTLDKMKHQK